MSDVQGIRQRPPKQKANPARANVKRGGRDREKSIQAREKQKNRRRGAAAPARARAAESGAALEKR